METPHIEYPCPWRYRLIGRSTDEIRAAVASVVGDRPHELAPGRESEGGSYVSLVLSIEVESEEARLRIYDDLAGNDAIKMVL